MIDQIRNLYKACYDKIDSMYDEELFCMQCKWTEYFSGTVANDRAERRFYNFMREFTNMIYHFEEKRRRGEFNQVNHDVMKLYTKLVSDIVTDFRYSFINTSVRDPKHGLYYNRLNFLDVANSKSKSHNDSAFIYSEMTELHSILTTYKPGFTDKYQTPYIIN